jgi:hypothetical protein
MRSALRLRALISTALLALLWPVAAPAMEPKKPIEPGVETDPVSPGRSQTLDPVARKQSTTPRSAKTTRRAKTSKRMRVVLPPGLIAPAGAGQFGAQGMGNAMGGGGMAMPLGGGGGMGMPAGGNGMGNGMGGGGMGMGNGMGGGGMGANARLTMPPQVGMSMLSSLIVNYTGDRGTWMVAPLMPGMGAANGLGVGGGNMMGMGNGFPARNGFRSVPARGPGESAARR